MFNFDYRRPATLSEAITALSAQPETKALAGGMSLLSAIKLRLNHPHALIDLRAIAELKGISVSMTHVSIGAMTRHADVAASPGVANAIPALARLAGGIGDRQVRNRGTIGGSIANSDPAACYPSAVLALGATVITDRRSIAADDFFTGLFETALQPDELIKSVQFPIPRGAAYAKFAHPASRFALVGVFVCRAQDESIRVAVTGAGPVVFRATSIERALASDFTAVAAERTNIASAGLNADMHADAEYRAHLVSVMASRAVAEIVASGGRR
jgi:carbon-monoxide dehydrogenase medium subunit